MKVYKVLLGLLATAGMLVLNSLSVNSQEKTVPSWVQVHMVITDQTFSDNGEIPVLRPENVQVMQRKNILKVTPIIPGRGDNAALQVYILYVPYGGIAVGVYKVVTKDDTSPLRTLSAASIAYDPDPRSGQALVNATSTTNKDLVRAAALDAIASGQADASQNVTRVLLPALNEMIDITTSRTIALDTHLPGLIFALLICVALLSGLLAGYALAERTGRSWLHMVVYALLITLTVYAVLDLDYPRSGLIRLDAADHAMVQLRDSIR
jgi:hypothetical protein